MIYEIRIPFADVIDWSDVDHTRNWNIFSDIIRSVAFYNILNREFFHKADDPLDGYFLATYEDYTKAVEIYSKIAENNESKLSNNEISIIKILIAAREQDIADATKNAKKINIAELHKKLETHNLSNLTCDDLYCFGIMDVKGIARAANMPDKSVNYIISGDSRKSGDGLTNKVVGLHCDKCSIKGETKTVSKNLIWYDGPDNIIGRGISLVPRDICEAETEKCKANYIREWIEEDKKWAGNTNHTTKLPTPVVVTPKQIETPKQVEEQDMLI